METNPANQLSLVVYIDELLGFCITPLNAYKFQYTKFIHAVEMKRNPVGGAAELET